MNIVPEYTKALYLFEGVKKLLPGALFNINFHEFIPIRL